MGWMQRRSIASLYETGRLVLQFGDHFSQRRDIFVYRLPDYLEVDTEVFVDWLISHVNHLVPWDRGVTSMLLITALIVFLSEAKFWKLISSVKARMSSIASRIS
jgi:hypothetical protein